MKKKLLVPLLLTLANISFGQNKILVNHGTSINGKPVSINVDQHTNEYTVKLKWGNNAMDSMFNLFPLDLNSFQNGVENKYPDSLTGSQIQQVRDDAKQLFYTVVANSLQASGTAPTAGNLIINDSVTVFKNGVELKFKINNVQIEFNAGLLENILVIGTLDMKDYQIKMIEYIENRLRLLRNKMTIMELKKDSTLIDTISLFKALRDLKNQPIPGDSDIQLLEVQKSLWDARNNAFDNFKRSKDRRKVKKEFNQLIALFNSEYMTTYGSKNTASSSILLTFENCYGIGFSSKISFHRLNNTYLFANHNTGAYSMKLGDMLKFIQRHNVNTKSFSPADQFLSLNPPVNIELKREPTNEIIKMHVFSDFIGVDEDKPNGLVQTELTKQFPLNTHRIQLFSRGPGKGLNAGLGAYFEPFAAITKIEDNNRRLILGSIDRQVGSNVIAIKHATTTEIAEFQHFSTGAKMNLLVLDWPRMISTFYLNYGGQLGLTAFSDSLKAVDLNGNLIKSGNSHDFTVPTLCHYPELLLRLRPDQRIEVSLSYRYNYLYAATKELTQVANADEFAISGSTGEIFDGFWKSILGKEKRFYYHTAQMLATMRVSDKGDLFFRSRFNWQRGEVNTNYWQIQLGYSFFFLKRN